MAFTLRPKLNKLPNGEMPVAQRERYVKALNKLTQLELLEIKERQEKLLAKQAKLDRLPDKGQRIRDFYDKLLAELERRTNVDEAAAMFSELNIAAKGTPALNKLEWEGSYNSSAAAVDPSADVLDSDDEAEVDPLRVLAQRTMHERKIKVLPAEPSLITAEDFTEIKSFQADPTVSDLSAETCEESSTATLETVNAEIVTIDVSKKLPTLKPKLEQVSKATTKTSHLNKKDSEEVEQHVRYVANISESVQTQPEKFKPYKTTRSNVHDPAKERARKQGPHWEVTAATPPPLQHSSAKLLKLLDSVELQTNYLVKLKALQEEKAAERLAAKLERLELRKIQMPDEEVLKTNPMFTAYRDITTASSHYIEGDPSLNETNEVHDPLDEEGSSPSITYTVFE